MRNSMIMTTLALAMASLAVQAVTITTAASGNWTAAATWTGGIYPGQNIAGDVARIQGGFTVTLDSGLPFTMGNINIGRSSATGTLIVNSGANLTVTSGNNISVGDTFAGYYTQNEGTVNEASAFNIGVGVSTTGSAATINNGTLNIGTALAVGKGAASTLTINGGSVMANAMPVGAVGINSSASLLGGSLQLGALLNPLTFNSAGSTLTIANAATLTLGGNQNTAIAGFAGGNLLWATGSSPLGGLYGTGDQTFDNGFGSYLHSFYDSGVNKTIVWVDLVPVPEPATLSLAVLGGIGLLAGRRMRRS